MSLREIDLALREIGRRRGVELQIEARLHGMKIEMPEVDAPKADLTKAQEERAMAAINETLERKRREAAERGGQ